MRGECFVPELPVVRFEKAEKFGAVFFTARDVARLRRTDRTLAVFVEQFRQPLCAPVRIGGQLYLALLGHCS